MRKMTNQEMNYTHKPQTLESLFVVDFPYIKSKIG